MEQSQSDVATVAPLTNWKNAPTLENLKQDYQDAKPAHDEMKGRVQNWLDNLNVEGKAKITAAKGSSSIQPKLIRKQAEWRYPALSDPFLSTEDLFNVSPVTWEDVKSARKNQILLNNQINTKIDKVAFVDEYVRAAVDEGTAVVRVGWKFEEEEYEAQEPIVEFRVNPVLAAVHEQLEQMRQESPSDYQLQVPEELQQAHEMTLENGVPIEPVVLGQRTVKKTRTVKNHPVLDVCEHGSVLIDPSCKGDLSKAKFIIYEFETSYSELKKDGRYKNLDMVQLDNNSPLNNPDHVTTTPNNFNFKDKPRKIVVAREYWGYWDIDGTGMVKPFVATWIGNTLIRMEENPYPDKELPFVVVSYLPKRKSVYGEPDGALLEDNQKIIGAVIRGMVDIMGKSANGQTGIRKDMLDATNKRRFERGLDYEFNGNVDPRQGVFMHTYPEIPQSAQFMLQLQQFEAESMTGVKAFSQGIGSQSLGDVAAGIRGALDAASKRELAILRRLSEGMVKIGRKIMAMNREFLSEKEVVRVTNEEFTEIDRNDLPGNFDLKLSISTAEEDNNKAQELAFMLQTTGNNMDPDLHKMILADIARLRKMPELAKRIESYKPQPDPVQQKIQQLNLELLAAQVQETQANIQKILAEAQLGSAKIGTEQAKANHLKSDTDLKNLDFVEQESGVKQERNLQLQGKQAESQAQLAVTQHQLDSIANENNQKFELAKEFIKSRNKK